MKGLKRFYGAFILSVWSFAYINGASGMYLAGLLNVKIKLHIIIFVSMSWVACGSVKIMVYLHINETLNHNI